MFYYETIPPLAPRKHSKGLIKNAQRIRFVKINSEHSKHRTASEEQANILRRKKATKKKQKRKNPENKKRSIAGPRLNDARKEKEGSQKELTRLIKIQTSEKSSLYERAAVHVRAQSTFLRTLNSLNLSPRTHPLPLILLLQSTNSHFNRFHLRM